METLVQDMSENTKMEEIKPNERNQLRDAPISSAKVAPAARNKLLTMNKQQVTEAMIDHSYEGVRELIEWMNSKEMRSTHKANIDLRE